MSPPCTTCIHLRSSRKAPHVFYSAASCLPYSLSTPPHPSLTVFRPLAMAVTHPPSLLQIFTLYARSHLYYAFELMFMLICMYMVRGCEVCNYGSLTWSGWLLAFVLIFAPLWFNPFSFDTAKVKVNYMAWQRWMHGDVDPGTGTNWYTWNR